MDSEGIGSAVQQIVDIAKGSRTATIMDAKGEKAGSYYLVGPDGTASLKLAGPHWHRETLNTPLDLVAFIRDHGETPDGGSVFITEEQIAYVYNLADRRDVAICPLKLSPQYQWLKSASVSASQMTQRDLIRVLRITFRNCLLSDNILSLMRNLKIENGATGETNIQQGRESMGRQITNAVTGVDTLPDEIGMNVPVFENFGHRAKIQCALEVFPAEGTFRLTPFPMEVQNALETVIDNIAGLFDAKELPAAYRGKP